MRIVGGRWRGTALASGGKGDAAAHLRPTSDKVRESLFNILEHGDYPALEGARVLDLFAGTGAVGFEALSRGAAEVQFIDNGAKSTALLRENAGRLSASGQVRITRRNATRLGENPGPGYGLIFLDPPYGRDLGPRTLTNLHAQGWLAKDAIICLEDDTPIPAPDGFETVAQRTYGGTHISLLTIS